MPDEARTKQMDPDQPRWGYVEELLAQVVEEVSVLAADQRRKKPREVPRPGVDKNDSTTPSAQNDAQLHGGLFAAAQERMRTVSG